MSNSWRRTRECEWKSEGGSEEMSRREKEWTSKGDREGGRVREGEEGKRE